MVNLREVLHLTDLVESEGNGSGWSVTYDCFMFNANLHSICSGGRIGFPNNGFLIRLQLSHLLKPIYIPRSSSFHLDYASQLIHLPSSQFSSYSSTLRFVLSTLSHLGVPSYDPHPLAHLIFSFACHHHHSASNSLVPLFISFTSTTVLHDYDQAVDWLHGGSPDSQVLRTLRSTVEWLIRLKNESFDGSGETSTCMVCLDGFDVTNSASRLPCSHVFHFRCVSQWLSLDHRCPVCRTSMPWVQAFLPDVPSSPSSPTSNLDDIDQEDEEDDSSSDNFVVPSSVDFVVPSDDDYLVPSSDEPAGIFTKLGYFLRKLVQNMLT